MLKQKFELIEISVLKFKNSFRKQNYFIYFILDFEKKVRNFGNSCD